MILISFILCLVFIVYVYLGYPSILWFLTRNIQKRYPETEYEGDISIVMVVCNEADNIMNKIDNLKELEYSKGGLTFIIVDDCSDDNTVDLIQSSNFACQLIRSDQRLGKANGINLAMEAASTELVAFVDCRQQLGLSVIEHLSSWFAEDPAVGAISGELMFKPASNTDFSGAVDGYWRYEKYIRKAEARYASVPGVTGALYMLRASTFKPIAINTLLDDVQIPMVSASQGYRIGYDDRAIAWDEPATSIEKEQRRKIRTLGGNYQLLMRFPYWVVPFFHPIAWQFFSHKIARLLVPFIILLSILLAFMLMTNYPLIAISYLSLLATGLFIIPLAYIYPEVRSFKLLKLIESFILMNWFCFLAFLYYFFSHREGAWK